MRPRFLEGHHVYVRGVQRADIERTAFWADDREVTRYLSRGTWPGVLEKALRDFDASLAAPMTEVEFGVCTRADDTLIGVTGLHTINWTARSAEFRILVGEKKYWGKGIGTEATQLMCVYGFEVLNLNKVWLGVATKNESAARTYVKAGFTVEGVLRQDTYRNNTYYDTTRMSLLRGEYYEKRSTWPIADLIAKQFPA